jgi:ribonucleoside-diphosphate reductase alpha chain
MALNDSYFLNPAHRELAKARYFLKDQNGELVEQDIDEVFIRVTNHLYKNDLGHKESALKLRREKKVIDAGRILAQAGTRTKNLYNCFIIGFEDDTREAISELKRKHFSIQAQGGGTGINFSTLRPNGSICKTTQSRSSGATGFITDFSYQSSNVEQGGNRSGANLGLLEDWHPDLFEFITKKSTSNWENIRKFSTVFDEDEFAYFQWTNPYQWQMFNVSVALSDQFMKEVVKKSDKPWKLSWKETEWFLWDFKNKVGPKTNSQFIKQITVTAPDEKMARFKASSKIPFFNNRELELIDGPYHLTAKEWFKLICKNAHKDGCPGIIFIDFARKFHNGEYFNPIEGCNPCSEQVMPRNSVCDLSSLILPTFIEGQNFNWDELEQAVSEAVRGLDNVIDSSATGEKDIDKNAKKERRIGLGTTGVAEMLIKLKLKYSSGEGRKFVAKVLEFIRDKAYKASVELAKEKGSFPAFDFGGFSKSEFFKTLPKNIKNSIKKYGIRNVTLLTQAPVGTTGTMIGYSQGCEPYFAMCFIRNSRVGTFKDGSPAFVNWLEQNNVDYSVYDYNLSKLKKDFDVPEYFEEAHDISWQNHLKMQAIFAKYVDSSVSKTLNISNSATVGDVEKAYLRAYELGVKSTTVYRDGSKQQILEHISANKLSGAKPQNIVKAHAPDRPDELVCDIHHTSIKGEKWTVLVGILNEVPYEIFCAPQDSFELSDKYKRGKLVKNKKSSYYLDTGDFKIKNISKCLESDEHRVITRMLSTCLRFGTPIDAINDQLSKVDGSVVDFSKAMLRVLRKYENVVPASKGKIICTTCGSSNIILNSGCPECLDCGMSKCG